MTGGAGDIVGGLRKLIRDGGREADLRAAAPAFGMRLRRVRLQPGSRGTTPWWQRDQGPLLAFRQIDGGPVLLLPDRRGGYRLEDAGGQSRPLDASLAATLSPDACAPVRAGGVEPVKPERWLKIALCDGRADRMLALLAAAGGGVAAVLPSVAVLLLGERALAGGTTAVAALAVVLLLAASAAGLCERVRRVASARSGAASNLGLHGLLWERLLAVPPGMLRTVPGAIQEDRLRDGITAMQQAVARRQALIEALVRLGPALAVMGWAAAWPALAGGCVTVVGGLLRARLLRRSARARRTGRDAAADSWHSIELPAASLPQLRLLGADLWVTDRAMSALRKLSAQVGLAAAHRADADAVAQALMLGVPLLVGGLAMQEGGGMPVAAAAALAALPAVRAVLGLADAFGRLPDGELIAPLRPLLEAAPDSPPGAPDPGPVERLDLCDLTFTHPGAAAPCLCGVSLSLARGQVVAVAGPSGSGKSTLIALALGLLRPDSGVVRINGRDLRSLDAAAVRGRIGAVLQDEQIGVATIRSVILGMAPLPVERAWEAARLVRLDADIADLPMGIQTLVGEDSFPAGLMQRLLIARALARDPDLLVLDEATAALDEDIQAALFADLRARGTAVLVASHRPSTLALADEVLDLSGVPRG
ncbi:ABC-type bacteriocin/lantibiotic exporter, contains an N-terminal double-glycine peptidase domain [Azospirillum oryzae]|uniref:ABC-type bacteriocin/lantibiotic exporter, contains an N-terminal double-glycine peptidase domain n=1 Tax=Azospirillum oryzae TaxID=286727 RepID=A0A1X7FL17_9PROT|nr:ATP-binding cassette domain-containing protein [Azospirillum oryzae]SMF54076.1 ABC-type bacteriocin/lantibiotic exporter, contains an N-terminal double-glycine peptidase domain [Azospirillum oryzae]